MSIYNGTLVLIKAGNGATPEVFTPIGGLRTSSMTLDNHVLDATNVESGVWRELMETVGISSVSMGGSGLFSDAASEEMVRGYAFAGTANNYQFIFANGDCLSGPFIITSYQRSGDYGGEEIYSLMLASSGTINFVSA